jgi:hypothetical protein
MTITTGDRFRTRSDACLGLLEAQICRVVHLPVDSDLRFVDNSGLCVDKVIGTCE